jgi:uncharacterized membrane protein YcaP (DUF421 family)
MDIFFRAIVVFFLLYVLMRAVGRRELSSLQPFDLILLIVLGDAVQQGLTQDDYSLTGAAIAVITIAGLQVLLSYLGFKFPKVRPLLEGVPIIIVQDGNLIERNLKRERVSRDEICEQARKQSIESLAEVKWAVLETNGEISFIKKN